VSSMSPESHDAAFAAVSHLPHVLAFAMMNSITGQNEGDDFLSLAGPGFRDFTRIAASDPKVWRDILLSNRDELIAQSKLFRQALDNIEQAMQNGDSQSLEDMLTLASETRAHWRMGAKRK
jgi:prephenate dehydrogenase